MELQYVVVHTHNPKAGHCFFCGSEPEGEENDGTIVMALIHDVDGGPVWDCCLYANEAELRDNIRFRAQMSDDYAQSIETLDTQDRLLDLGRELGRQVARADADAARQEASSWGALASDLDIPPWPQDIPEQAQQARRLCAVCQRGMPGSMGLG